MLKSVREQAPAKINLSLRVGGRRADHRHEVQTVIWPITLTDEVEIHLHDDTQGVHFECAFDEAIVRHHGLAAADSAVDNQLKEIAGSDNLAVKAAEAVLQRLKGEQPGITLRLTKVIPWQAGLGGGSADAGAVLRGLTRLLGDALPVDAVFEIAAELGSDVSAAVLAAPVLAEGAGERLKAIEAISPELMELATKAELVVFKPPTGVSTALAYRALGRRKLEDEPKLPPVELAAEIGLSTPSAASITQRKGLTLLGGEGSSGRPGQSTGSRDLLASFVNDFEPVIYAHYPLVQEADALLREAGAEKTLLAGSGSALVGFTFKEGGAEQLARKLSAKAAIGWFVRPVKLMGSHADDGLSRMMVGG